MKHRASTDGFTLLELVIVLAILAIVTALATREVAHVQDQRRFESSQRTLESIRDAVLGSPNDRTPDGVRVQGGFVADMGRMPADIEELWTTTASTFQVGPATSGNMAPSFEDKADPEILVASGWRGPYLRLPIGAGEPRDGWGNAFTNWQDTVGWHVKPSVETPAPYNPYVRLTIEPHEYTASAWGYVTVHNDSTNAITGSAIVRVYGPSRDHEGKIEAIETDPLSFTVSAKDAAQSYWMLKDLSIGPRAIRAYAGDFGATSLVTPATFVAGPSGPFNFELRNR